MKIMFLSLLLVPAVVLGMGNRPPTDPATYGDIQTVQTQIDNVAYQGAQNTDAIQTNTDTLNKQQTQIDDLNALKVQLGVSVRLYDAKYVAFSIFSLADIQGSGGNAVGLNVGFKLGKSYEQRLLEKQQKQIDFLLSRIKPEAQ